jgi:ferritin-like metal-binding protein YciE
MAASKTRNGAAPAPMIDREDPDQLAAGRDLVVQYLNEAHATEQALVTTLQAHITMTPTGTYRRLLERHLGETRQQARAIERRLEELGGSSGLLSAAYGLVQTVVGQALALSKGPVDLLRGASGEEKLLKNAKDECATEALEIATYDALEATANAVGDDKTARLAARHREQEERMLADLRAEIPILADATVLARAGGQPIYDVTRTGAADKVRSVKS